jgi:hypothetical protein
LFHGSLSDLRKVFVPGSTQEAITVKCLDEVGAESCRIKRVFQPSANGAIDDPHIGAIRALLIPQAKHIWIEMAAGRGDLSREIGARQGYPSCLIE